MIPIELKKRYPHSREEDITDAFMRGYQACAVQGGDAEMDNCQVQAPQNYMQQSPNNGADLISRADVLKFPIRLDHYDEEHGNRDFVLGIESVMEYVEALPSADAVPQLKQTDTLIIADALRYLAKDTERHLVDRTRADALRQQFLKYGASMCKGGAE